MDPLLDLMNGYETLRFYGKIRGIPDGVIEERIAKLVNEIGLKRFAYKPCGTYSGGNKRLSLVYYYYYYYYNNYYYYKKNNY